MESEEERYKAFVLHFQDHDRLGLPTDLGHMREMAKKLNLPIPKLAL